MTDKGKRRFRSIAYAALFACTVGQIFLAGMSLGHMRGKREGDGWRPIAMQTADKLGACQATLSGCNDTLAKANDTIEDSMAETRKIACVCSKALGIPLDKRIKCAP